MRKESNMKMNLKEYFNNGGRGYDHPYYVSIDDLNVGVKLYYHNLKESKINKIKEDIHEVVNQFKKLSQLQPSPDHQDFEIYIFDKKGDYTHFGGKQFKLGLGEEGGKHYYMGGKDGVISEMYVYQKGHTLNLQHELAHGLTYYATNGNVHNFPKVLLEGIADFFEHQDDQAFYAGSSSIDKTQNALKNMDLNQIIQLKYSRDDEEQELLYKAGHALVMYLQEKHPNVISDYLSALREGKSDNKSQNLLTEITSYNEDFKNWLATNNTDNAMKEINALKVVKGEKIADVVEKFGDELKEVSYYKANIQSTTGDNVGGFSLVGNYFGFGHLLVYHNGTNDRLDISRDYHFLKAIKSLDGDYEFVYCDSSGNEYKNSFEYKRQAAEIVGKYDSDVKNALERAREKVDTEYNRYMEAWQDYKSSSNITSEARTNLVNIRNSCDIARDEEYKLIIDIVDNLSLSNSSKEAQKILQGLTYIDQSAVKNSEELSLSSFNNKIFAVKPASGSENVALNLQSIASKPFHAASIYDDGVKIGEFGTDCGFFGQVKGSSNSEFVFVDRALNLHTIYKNGAYVGITQEDGKFIASFIEGRKVEHDNYHNHDHLHRNELISPNIRHIKSQDMESLLLKNTTLLNDSDSFNAQYSKEQKSNGVIVEKTSLLDDKGTDDKSDDVYGAAIMKQGDLLHLFKNTGFYITKDGSFFIHDHGKNFSFQFPKEITHLKLVNHDGSYKLVPCTSDGNEFPKRMPPVTDEYRYISPIFAHEYEQKYRDDDKVNIGLINFDKYQDNIGQPVFMIKPDENSDSHFTEVRLIHSKNGIEQDVGMLSNSFNNFRGKIFFSADYNYSYNDFLASVSPQVAIKESGDGVKTITFDRGKGDIGNTDRGYTDHYKIFTNKDQSEAERFGNSNNIQKKSAYYCDSDKDALGKCVSNVLLAKSDITNNSQHEQGITDRESMQNDSNDSKEVILRSHPSSREEVTKANIKVEYETMNDLHKRVDNEHKSDFLSLWRTLHESSYNVARLPEQYYFDQNKFVMSDEKGGYVELDQNVKFTKNNHNIYNVEISDVNHGVVTNFESELLFDFKEPLLHYLMMYS